jgi:hypothetical protein
MSSLNAYFLFPFQEESSPIFEHHSQKLSLNFARWTAAPFDVEVQDLAGAAKKVDSYFPFTGFVHVKMERKMVVGIEPQAQPLDLNASNLAQPVPFPMY